VNTQSQKLKTSNSLLLNFPAEIIDLLQPTSEQYRSNDRLSDENENPALVFFPDLGTVISMTRTSSSGVTVEVGIVGFEGFASVQAVLSNSTDGTNAVVQVAGSASRVKMEALQTALSENARVRKAVLGFAGHFMGQIAQHAVCNRVHSIEQRLGKWLLGVRDRTESDELGLTHEFLSHMLGVRRAGVTVAVGDLVRDSLITNRRSMIVIRDREGLERRACECYIKMHP
jgi:CRP-like cAMP-binding protein